MTDLEKGDICLSLCKIIGERKGNFTGSAVHRWWIDGNQTPICNSADAMEQLHNIKSWLYQEYYPYESGLAEAIKLSKRENEPIPKCVRIPREIIKHRPPIAPKPKPEREHRTIKQPTVLTVGCSILELSQITRVYAKKVSVKQLAFQIFDSTWPTKEIKKVAHQWWERETWEHSDPYEDTLQSAIVAKYGNHGKVPRVITTPQLTVQMLNQEKEDRRQVEKEMLNVVNRQGLGTRQEP